MDLGLVGRSVLITGGSKGIGFATADAMLAEGADVTIVAAPHPTSTTQPGAWPAMAAAP